MSAAFYIVLDRETPGFNTTVNGKFLAKDADRIDRVSKAIGIPSLSDFICFSPGSAESIVENSGKSPNEMETAELPQQRWFDAQAGLDFIEKIAAFIDENPTIVKNTKGVLDDLEEYKVVLQKAKSIGARWNLQVDF
jgi:hypothetical protein